MNRITQSAPLNLHVVLMGAFLLLTLTAIGSIEVGAAICGTVLLLLTSAVGSSRSEGWIAPLSLSVAVFLTAVAILGGSTQAVAATAAAAAPFVLVAGCLVLRADLGEAWVRWVGTGVLVVIVFLVGFIWIAVIDPPEIDVLEFHVAAARLVGEGSNPYAAAHVVDTSPHALPGSEIVGYPYPPSTLALFVAAGWILGDPRWLGVVAIAVTVLLIVRPWASVGRQQAAALLALGLVLVVQPVTGHILRHGWTEPTTLPLLLLVGLLWRRNPVAAAIVLGLTLSLKQYWIVALPVVLLWPDEFRWKRLWIAGAVAGASLLPAFALDPAAAWSAMVTNLLALAPRPDSIGLAGVGWEVPLWVALVVSAGVAGLMATRSDRPARFIVALAATLAVSFLLGSQAFVNYWYLIAAMSLVAVVVDVSDREHESVDEQAVVAA